LVQAFLEQAAPARMQEPARENARPRARAKP